MSEQTAQQTVFDETLLDRLPNCRGRISPNAHIGAQSWFRAGGHAEILFQPKDQNDLSDFMAGLADDIPVTIIGIASNMIIRDGGIPGVTVRLRGGFTNIDILENHMIRVGSGVPDKNVALAAAKAGIGGLSFLSGIPGSIGGAVKMNAGAYGSELKDVLVEATAIDRKGNIHHLTPEDLDMRYRHTALPADMIVTGAVLKGHHDTSDNINAAIKDIREKREATQPIREKTGGSTFANPTDPKTGEALKSWQLIDSAGCRGLTIGGAQMSEKHCNFMINTGNASAFDLEQLGETVRQRVFDHSGILLRWEIRRIGDFANGQTLDIAQSTLPISAE